MKTQEMKLHSALADEDRATDCGLSNDFGWLHSWKTFYKWSLFGKWYDLFGIFTLKSAEDWSFNAPRKNI